MLARICSWPALGQLTCVEDDSATLTVLLEVQQARASDPWEVSLWHSADSEWHETSLQPLRDEASHPTFLRVIDSQHGPHLQSLYFTTSVPIKVPTSFTVKFRNHPAQSWKWAREHQNWDDGHVKVKTSSPLSAMSSQLGNYIENLNPELSVKNCRAQSPSTTLWVHQGSVNAASESSTCADLRLGIPWGKGSCHR